MTAEQFTDYLRKQCNGNQSGFARYLNVSPAYISDILRGTREPGPKVLKAMGFVRVVTYLRK